MGKFASIIAEASDAPAYFDKDSQIGDQVTGKITAISLRQTRNYKTKEPEFWKDGEPREQFVVVVQTDLAQFDGDDGKRSLYVKWWSHWRKAFAKAVLANGAEEPEVGGTLSVKFVGLGERDDDLSPAKLFEYQYAVPGATLPEAVSSQSPAKAK